MRFKVIKFLLGVIVVLSLIGGAVRFESNEESWQIIIHKENVISSIQDGAKRIYNIVEDLISNGDTSENLELILEEQD